MLLDLGVMVVWTVAVSYSVVIGISETALKTLYQGACTTSICAPCFVYCLFIASQTTAQWPSGWATVRS